MKRRRWCSTLFIVFMLAAIAPRPGGARAAEPVRIRVIWVVATTQITPLHVPR